MPEYYKTKIIRTDNLMQFYVYPEPITKDYDITRKNYDKSEEGKKQKSSINRARDNLILTIESNMTEYTKFLTLTFKENIHKRIEAFEKFKIFKKQFKKEFGYLMPYVAITEPQLKRQKKYDHKYPTIHFHIVVFLDKYLPFKDLKNIWGKYGSLLIKKVDDAKNTGIYFAKYLTKELLDLNKKALTKSRNLKEPITEYSHERIIPKNYTYSNTYNVPKYNKQGELVSIMPVQFYEIRINQLLDIE